MPCQQNEIIDSFLGILQKNEIVSLQQIKSLMPTHYVRLHDPIFISQILIFIERILFKNKENINQILTESLKLLQNNLLFAKSTISDNLNKLLTRNIKVGIYGISSTVLSSINKFNSLSISPNISVSSLKEKKFNDYIQQLKDQKINFSLLPECIFTTKNDIIITGAEAVFRNGILARPGTLQLAVCCKMMQKQLIFVCETTKFSDKFYSSQDKILQEFGVSYTDEFEFAENDQFQQFELVEFQWVDEVVTERGNFEREGIQGVISQLFVIL